MNTLKEILLSKEKLEPETIHQLFPTLTDSDMEKINATRTILHTRFFFEDMFIFEDIVLALNGIAPDFGHLEGCTPEQIWYAVDLVSTSLRPEVEYSWEVQAYCKWMLNDAGVFIYPKQFVDLLNPYYEMVVELASKNEFSEDDVTHVQASKYKAIQAYIDLMKSKNQLSWR
jgi:hypothetical protein